MESPKHRIQLTFTEAVVHAIISVLLGLACFGFMLFRLQKVGIHHFDWIASLLLLFALMRIEGTIKLILYAVRIRRLDLQTRCMEQNQKRAGWQ